MIEPMTSTINCDRNADATEAPSDEAGTAFTSTPLRTPTVLKWTRAAPVLQSGAKNKKKAAPGPKDSCQADEEEDEAEVPATGKAEKSQSRFNRHRK